MAVGSSIGHAIGGFFGGGSAPAAQAQQDNSVAAQDNQGHEYLETLFVKLKNPLQSVQIEGLSENVISMSKTSIKIECVCSSGKTVTINRSQVQVL